MKVDPSAARLADGPLSRSLASADTTRADTDFSGSLRRQSLRADAHTLARGVRPASAMPDPPTPSRQPGPVASPPHAPAPLSPRTAAPPIPGDMNGDGAVNVFDFSSFAANYASGGAEADLDASGDVDEIDAAILRQNFGRSAETRTDDAGRAGAGPDMNHDGRVDVLDFGRFAAAYAAQDPEADLHADGLIDEVDIAVFRQLFRDAT